MLNVIKSENTLTIADTVIIPDAVIIPAVKKDFQEDVMPDLSELDGKSAEIIKIYIENAKKNIKAEARELTVRAQKRAEDIIAQAEAQSAEIIENAEIQRQEQLKQAMAEGESIRENARLQGLAEGAREKAEEADKLMNELAAEIDNMRIMQAQSTEQMYDEVKYFALDIAEKVVHKKISEDDTYLEELTKSAIAEFKDASWLTVEMSQDLSALAGKLQLPENSVVKTNLDGRERIVVTAKENIIDASIPEQLSNIRKYFDSVKDSGEDNC